MPIWKSKAPKLKHRLTENVEPEAVESVIARREAEGWRLVKEKAQKEGQVKLVFEPAPLPDLRDPPPQRKPIPLRRRLRNYAIVAIVPLALVCALIVFVALHGTSTPEQDAQGSMTRFLQASLSGDDVAAADETCSKYRVSVRYNSTALLQHWDANPAVTDVVIDGERAGAQVDIGGKFMHQDKIQAIAIDDRFEMLNEHGLWHVCDPRLENGIWGYVIMR